VLVLEVLARVALYQTHLLELLAVRSGPRPAPLSLELVLLLEVFAGVAVYYVVLEVLARVAL